MRLVEGVAEAAEGAQALCLMTEWEEVVKADCQPTNAHASQPLTEAIAQHKKSIQDKEENKP